MNRKAIQVGMLVFSFILLGLLVYLFSRKYFHAAESNVIAPASEYSIEPNTSDDPFYRITGASASWLYQWAEKEKLEGKLIVEQRRFKQYKGSEAVPMEPNEKYAISIYTEDYDVNKFEPPMYWEEVKCEFKEPYEELPASVRRLLDKFGPNNAGKTIGEVVPELAMPVLVCQIREGNVINSEPLEVRVLRISKDKLRFEMASEPFSLSTVKGITASDRVILYTEVIKDEKISIGLRSRYDLGLDSKCQ